MIIRELPLLNIPSLVSMLLRTAADEQTPIPPFSGWLQQRLPSKIPCDARTSAFDSGYGAGLSGNGITNNPFPADSADHLIWEGGWCEALDA